MRNEIIIVTTVSLSPPPDLRAFKFGPDYKTDAEISPASSVP